MWKETVMVYFGVTSHHLLQWTGENHENPVRRLLAARPKSEPGCTVMACNCKKSLVKNLHAYKVQNIHFYSHSMKDDI